MLDRRQHLIRVKDAQDFVAGDGQPIRVQLAAYVVDIATFAIHLPFCPLASRDVHKLRPLAMNPSPFCGVFAIIAAAISHFSINFILLLIGLSSAATQSFTRRTRLSMPAKGAGSFCLAEARAECLWLLGFQEWSRSQVDGPSAAIGKGGSVCRLDGALYAVHVLLVTGHQDANVVRQLHLQSRAPEVMSQISNQEEAFT